MDLFRENATEWDATPYHDLLYQQNQEIQPNPDQFSKWVVEMAIDGDLDTSEFSQGKIVLIILIIH